MSQNHETICLHIYCIPYTIYLRTILEDSFEKLSIVVSWKLRFNMGNWGEVVSYNGTFVIESI